MDGGKDGGGGVRGKEGGLFVVSVDSSSHTFPPPQTGSQQPLISSRRTQHYERQAGRQACSLGAGVSFSLGGI